MTITTTDTIALPTPSTAHSTPPFAASAPSPAVGTMGQRADSVQVPIFVC